MKTITVVVSGLIAGVIATSASAAFVQIRDAPGGSDPSNGPDGFLVPGTGSLISATFDGGPFATQGVGAFSFEADFGSGFSPFVTYCIEPEGKFGFDLNPQDLVGAQYEIVALATRGYTALEAQQAGILWSNAFNLSLTSALNAAAFQAVLWELSQDDGVHDFTSGNFAINTQQSYSDSVQALATEWFANITGGIWTTSIELQGLYGGDNDFQDFVFPVPGPAGLPLLAGAFLC